MLNSGSFGRRVRVLSCLAVILLWKRELVALSCCFVAVSELCLFLTAPCVGLQCLIVVFYDNTHLLFSMDSRSSYWNHIRRYPFSIVAVSVLCLFLMVPSVGLQCVIVVFPGYHSLRLFYRLKI